MTDTTLDRGTTQRSGDAMSDEPTALELADYLQRRIYTHLVRDRRRLDEAADMLRRLHAENEALQADNERLRQVVDLLTDPCESCEGSGCIEENHGQGQVEYLGCPDCQTTGRQAASGAS